jgi:hypothetical protein
MGKKTMFLLAMAMLLLLPSQVRAQDSPQQSVDLTTRMARTTHDGLRKIKNQPSKKIVFVAAPTSVETVQTTAADKKRDAVVKTKAQAAASVSKVKDKRETAIKKMAHHPAARTSLKSGNAPRRNGEVRDDDGVIIKPAEGQRKIYNRSGNALIYDPDGGSWLLTEQFGKVHVVFCDNGDVYIRDLISTYRNNVWVKGSLSGNTITIPTGQLVNYESYAEVPYAIYWGVKMDGDYIRNDARDVITMTIDGDQITLEGSDEDNIIGVFYEYEGNAFFTCFGDYESVYTFDHDFVPLDVVTVTPPPGLQTETWYTRGHYYEGSSVPFRGQVSLGFDGDDVYLQGLFANYPDAWMHGVINDGVVTFGGMQVLGELDGQTIYAVGYNGDLLMSYEMAYDEEGGVFTSLVELLANDNDETVNYDVWIEDLAISREDPFKPIEDYPYLNTFQTVDEQEAFTIIDANNDGDTWDFAYNTDENWFARYTYNDSFDADDWLVSPAFHFVAGKQYRLTFDTWNKGFDERIEVMAGSDATPESMTIQVVEPTDVTWEEPQQLEASIAVNETGTYYIGFHAISLADMNKLFVDNVMVDIYDMEAPAAPTDFTAIQTEEQLEVTLNFTAPEVRRNGEPLAANLEKIELVRDDQVIHTFEDVAPGAALTWVDNGEDLTLGLHKYYAVAYNENGAGDKSEVVALKLIATLNVPYTADLTQPQTIDIFTVIDANEDGCTWNWDNTYKTNYDYSADNAADDYLVTLPIWLDAHKNYNVVVNARNAGIDERFEVLLGTEPTAEALTTTVILPTDVTTYEDEGEEYEGMFSVNEAGKYYLAIHAISDADAYRLMVNYISIDFGAEPTAPAAPAISVAADELATLRANVTLTAPNLAFNGDPLTTNLTRIDILRDGTVVGCVEDVAPGTTVVYVDEPDYAGDHTYQAIPYNESGKGLKSEKVTVYVGPDIPSPVENFTAADGGDIVALNWDKVGNTGENGGPVNPATVNYLVWSTYAEEGWTDYSIEKNELLATLTDADAYDVPFDTDEGEQRMEYWIVETRNEANAEYEGQSSTAGLLVGAPYDLPLVEGFTDDELHYFWETNGTVMISGQSSDDDGSAMALLTEEEGMVYFNSGKLDLKGLAHPTLVFDVASPDIRSLAVYGSVDGGEFTLLQDNIVVGDDFSRVKVPLTALQGGRYARICLLAKYENASEVDHWEGELIYLGDMLLVDNIHIADLYQHDLSIAVSAPTSVVAGNTAKISFTVTNEGENEASGFRVLITAGDKVLLDVTSNQTMESFVSWSHEVEFPTSVLDDAGDVEILARIVYDMDQQLANNEAQAIITIVEPALPAPTDLCIDKMTTNDLVLSWTAPSTDGTVSVTEDFDDAAAFPEFSLGGITATHHTGALGDWSLYDGNGLVCYSFTGFEVPNLGNPMAWMVFNSMSESFPVEVGTVYEPHSGNQLLLSTCVSDGDPIPATDHWLISPELMGNGQDISFFARVITPDYGYERFEVLYSTTDDDIDSFVSLQEEWLDATDWTEYTFTLPEGTKYFAIRHTAQDIFGLMLDDVTFERGASAPVGYNIYVDGVCVGTTPDTAYEMPATGLSDGHHTIAVTAVYEGDKESAPATATIDITSGINEITLDGKPVDVYTIDGRLVRRQATSLEGLKGIYLIGNKVVHVK